ncbi:hypothetical protein [Streptococcus saliviloxodontae]|uniref:Uncharacterized protein n=1 Tax=Streptococcus saliviloxodontae TaxID=1349416 RepID=A0ABS2PJU7_9STRE|nr:hypothetical protein [Streptococcus saliviloxodontae]MBM7635547.1 hypothetical protein [Streptococcus saliviloxodontae]
MKKWLIFISTIIIVGIAIKVIFTLSGIYQTLFIIAGLTIYLLAALNEYKKIR